MIENLASWFQPWADLYGSSTPVQATIVFIHLAALVVAGGLAVATDRAIVRAVRADAAARAYVLRELAAAHRLVLLGIAALVVTGGLMLLADLEALLPSVLFWVKMALFALLLGNGLLLQRAQQRIVTGEDLPEWAVLRAAAVRSSALWVVLLLVGTLLPLMV